MPSSPCMAVLIEMPMMRAGSTRETASVIASKTLSAMVSGSCTCQPGWGFSSRYSREVVILSAPPSENSDALAAVVPTSSPRMMSLPLPAFTICRSFVRL